MPADLAGLPGRAGLVVHLSFLLLLGASAVRYLTHHGLDQRWQLVLVLSLALAGVYGVIAAAPRHDKTAGWVWLLVLLWAGLVLNAPSFAWCAFSLFFICRSTLSGRAGYVGVAGVVVPAALGLFLLGGGTDYAMLLGPLAA
ncbi:MAG: sensor histidine kinase, partial [Actinomycetota bacterium]|nr:sensor histidine kinase [Actinomycetota bacterium]